MREMSKYWKLLLCGLGFLWHFMNSTEKENNTFCKVTTWYAFSVCHSPSLLPFFWTVFDGERCCFLMLELKTHESYNSQRESVIFWVFCAEEKERDTFNEAVVFINLEI